MRAWKLSSIKIGLIISFCVKETTLGSVWDREPSDDVRGLSIENMKRLGLVLSDTFYIALNAYEEKKGKPLTKSKIARVMDNELDLIITQNLKEESWREIIFEMAQNKYHRQKKSV